MSIVTLVLKNALLFNKITPLMNQAHLGIRMFYILFNVA